MLSSSYPQFAVDDELGDDDEYGYDDEFAIDDEFAVDDELGDDDEFAVDEDYGIDDELADDDESWFDDGFGIDEELGCWGKLLWIRGLNSNPGIAIPRSQSGNQSIEGSQTIEETGNQQIATSINAGID